MRHLAASLVLICVHYVAVHAQTVLWKFPLQGQNLQPNVKDSILLDWTSTLPTTILRMWCVNGTDGVTQDLASSFYVNSTGPFNYNLQTYYPSAKSFPLLCHGELAEMPVGSGVDSPAGFTWHSNSAEAAKTISQTLTASSSSSTIQSVSTTTSTTSIATTESPSQSSNPTSSTKQSTTTSDTLSSSATVTQQPVNSGPAGSNNTGAIVGGVIGGVALISFIVIAMLFLRKRQRDQSSGGAAQPPHRGFYLFNFYKKGGPKAGTTGVFEKEADHGAHEKDGTGVPEASRVPELPGTTAWKKAQPGSETLNGARGDDGIGYHAVELP